MVLTRQGGRVLLIVYAASPCKDVGCRVPGLGGL
eukprot:COSAG02_NODE_868_length_16360_cov_12.608204_1_plen_33_part_10